MTENKKLEIQGNFKYRFDIIELSESLKFIGCEKTDSISEFDAWKEFDKSLMNNRIEPITEIRLWQNETNKDGAWTLGCLVYSINELREGTVGVDTGWTKILVLTVHCLTAKDVTDSEEHFRWAHFDSWNFLPIDIYQLSPPAPGADRGFCTKNNGSTSLIEIYPADINNGIPEMCFYYPFPVDK